MMFTFLLLLLYLYSLTSILLLCYELVASAVVLFHVKLKTVSRHLGVFEDFCLFMQLSYCSWCSFCFRILFSKKSALSDLIKLNVDWIEPCLMAPEMCFYKRVFNQKLIEFSSVFCLYDPQRFYYNYCNQENGVVHAFFLFCPHDSLGSFTST